MRASARPDPRSGARRGRRRLAARPLAPGLAGALLAAGCAHAPEPDRGPAPEPEPPVIVLGADSDLVYDGEPRPLREVFVLEVREPLVLRRIDGRRVARGATFYHLLPGEHVLEVDYFVGELDRAGRFAGDESVARWQLVRMRLRLGARAGEGAELESAVEDGSVTTRIRRGKTALVEGSVLIY